MNRPAKILVTDDEEVVVSLVRDCLESDGYEVTVATSGAEAESHLIRQSFDLLITDIRMPDFDGIELLRRAKKHQESIGAIFMTGYANMQSAKDAIKEGALDYLMKPFEIDEIRTAVRNALEKLASRSDSKAEVELDRMTRVTRLMHAVDDLPSLMRTALGATLAHCDMPYGAAIYYSPPDSKLVRLESSGLSDSDIKSSSMELVEDPFTDFQGKFPELKSEYFVSEHIDDHPMSRCDLSEEIRAFFREIEISKKKRLVSFVIGRNNKIFGFIFVPVSPDKLLELNDEFKFVNLTVQQTALSIENLILLHETRGAYRQLQDLQTKTVSLETMAARGEFAAEIGHELKNFLGIVYGNFSLLERHLGSIPGSQESGFPKYFEAITSNLDKMKRFATELMRETRLAGKKEIINVNSQLHELGRFMRPQKRFSSVTLSVQSPQETICMNIDPMLFQQLVYNLVNNAADACTGREGSQVEVILTADDSSLTIAIADNGAGIEPELLEKAFSSRFTTKSDGNGFGLMVSRKIIDSHQGKLKIDSKVNIGTTISITFPLTTRSGEAPHKETTKIIVSEFFDQ